MKKIKMRKIYTEASVRVFLNQKLDDEYIFSMLMISKKANLNYQTVINFLMRSKNRQESPHFTNAQTQYKTVEKLSGLVEHLKDKGSKELDTLDSFIDILHQK